VNISELLLEQGADPNIADKTGKTALLYAARDGHTELIPLLVQYGGSIAIRDRESNTPLMLARTNKHSDAEQVILKLLGKPD
jgi:ankyrin repeat/SAM/basic leucine zipper domain-containing protein 1